MVQQRVMAMRAFTVHMDPVYQQLFPNYMRAFTLDKLESRANLVKNQEMDHLAAVQWSEITCNMIKRLPLNEVGADATGNLDTMTFRRFYNVPAAGGRQRMRDLFEVRAPSVIDGPIAPKDFGHLMLRAAADIYTWNADYWQVTRPFDAHLRDPDFLKAYKNYRQKVGQLPVHHGLPIQVNGGCFTPVGQVLASKQATPCWAFCQLQAVVSARTQISAHLAVLPLHATYHPLFEDVPPVTQEVANQLLLEEHSLIQIGVPPLVELEIPPEFQQSSNEAVISESTVVETGKRPASEAVAVPGKRQKTYSVLENIQPVVAKRSVETVQGVIPAVSDVPGPSGYSGRPPSESGGEC